ncbi:hypothetical protein F5888DRAFT_1624221 [Russula emetica]|nr:hypothetical protein F5888DRAFT_1624221 [Russula emetica]
MDGLTRSAKSGNDWTEDDLRAYNIQIQCEDVATFFGDSNLPLPEVDEEILTTLEAKDMSSTPNAKFIRLLDRAMIPAPDGEESAIRDFASQLFDILGYMGGNIITRTRKRIPYLICGEWRVTMTDVCLIDYDILLLVQEDKRSLPDELRDPRPQLIAEAIAAFDRNNHLQRYAEEQTIMPGIVLVGTMPTFLKIPVTSNLVRHVQYGTYPPEPTVVSIHVPDLPRPRNRYKEGMRPLDNREALLRYYEAFKRIVGIRQKD